jgi:hypothetical protein
MQEIAAFSQTIADIISFYTYYLDVLQPLLNFLEKKWQNKSGKSIATKKLPQKSGKKNVAL